MMNKLHLGRLILTGYMVISLVGCAATQTAISKKDLDVQTKMSSTIFLDPVAPEKRTVLIQVRNTSDKPELSIKPQIAQAIANKGLTVVEDPDKAHYLLQANVLQVGKIDLREKDEVLASGYGGTISGGVLGTTIGALATDSDNGMIAAGLIGAIAGTVADAMVKDVAYSIITDIQISEKVYGKAIKQRMKSNLKQGESTKIEATSSEETNWKRHQTRIVSTANKVNLEFDEAVPHLVQGLSNSLSGLIG